MKNDLVSLVIPTYNYGRYIKRAITSCLDQTYRHVEVLVIDDGSTDNTRELVSQYDGRVHYLYQENRGVSAARNKGLERATGEYIAFLDADDYLLPDSVSSRVEILKKHNDVGIVFTDTYSAKAGSGTVSTKNGNSRDRMSDRFYDDLLLHHLRFQTSAAMMRSSIAKRFSFPVHLRNGEDLVYFSKVFFAAKGYFLARPTVVNVRHDNSLRHDVAEILRQDMALVTAILDDPFYRGALEYMRKDLTSKRHLDLFRTLYLAGERERAFQHYRKAIAAKPGNLMKLSYLSKAAKLLFKTGKNS